MDKVEVFRDSLLSELRTRLIPWSQAEDGHMPLIEPPFGISRELPMRQFMAEPLPQVAPEKSYLQLYHWPEQALISKPFPYLGCVLEGTADLRFTRTPQFSASNPRGPGAVQRSAPIHVLTLPPGSFFVIPAGVPHSDGHSPHWEGERPEKAFSRILWIMVLPAGVLCHVCTTEGCEHHSNCPLFVHDPHLTAVADLVIDELRTRRRHFNLAARAQLNFLLLRVERALQAQEPLLTGKGIRLFPSEADAVPTEPSNQVLDLARRYIQTHLEEPLTPAEIAAHANISVSHLNRLFRAEMGMPVMQFVSQCRLEMAKSMLENTDMPMANISRMTGFYDAAHFARSFSTALGAPPSAYRAKFRGPARNTAA